MAARVYRDFIGPEGGSLSRMRIDDPRLGVGDDPRFIPDSDLLKQISIAREIEAQRGLTEGERDRFNQVLKERETRQQRQSAIEEENLLKQSLPGQPEGAQFNPIAELEREEAARLSSQRANLSEIFGRTGEEAAFTLEKLFAPQRSKQIAEEAALGRLTSPVSSVNIGAIDRNREGALADIIRKLAIEKAQQEVGLQESAAQRIARAREFGTEAGLKGKELGQRERLTLAELLQSGRQFGKTFGLQEQGFAEQQRRTALSDLLENRKLNLAEQEMGLKYKKEDDDIFGMLTKGIGVVKGLTDVGTGLFGKKSKKSDPTGLTQERSGGLF